MPQSATITVLDKQKVSDKPKAPYKIQTSTGDVFKAWPDVGQDLRSGETYNVAYEARTNGAYTDKFILSANKSTDEPTPGSSGDTVLVRKVGAAPPVVDWAAKEEDMATLAMFKAAWLAGEPIEGMAQCLDQCRSEWRAHKARMRNAATAMKAPKAPVAAPKSMAQPVTTMNDWVEDANDPAFPD